MDKDSENGEEKECEARAPRKAIMLAAILTDKNGIAHRIRIRNLSATGLGGVIEHPVALDDVVRLDLPGMKPVKAIVTRWSGKEFGVRFQNGIVPEHVGVKIENEGSNFALRDIHKMVHDHRRPGLIKS